MIIDEEMNIGIGKIDRKTINIILSGLEFIKIIK